MTPFSPPYHPHLHTNGSMTHPVILILNAMLAHKRVMFLGHGLPANQVARMVLSACAMASGCGQVLRGYTESSFPYANLASLDILEEFSGFVAGVTNPRFEELPMTWDVLCNIETGRVTVSKNLKSGSSVSSMRQSSDTSLGSLVKVEEDNTAGTPTAKMNATTKADCVDNQFMDDVSSANGRVSADHVDTRGDRESLWRVKYPTPVHRLCQSLRPHRRFPGIHAHWHDQDRVPVRALSRRNVGEWCGVRRRCRETEGNVGEWTSGGRVAEDEELQAVCKGGRDRSASVLMFRTGRSTMRHARLQSLMCSTRSRDYG